MDKSKKKYSDLIFNFDSKNRLIKCTTNKNEKFKFNTSLLKVLKPIHISINKKKNTEKKYIILEINDNYDLNNELNCDDFLISINKLHELSQENVRKNSIKWFNTEFDDIGLDLKVKKPIETQKEKQFIKIVIPNNENIVNKIGNLEKNNYIDAEISYNGLKVSSDYLMGEYEIINFITKEEYEKNITQNEEIIINKYELLNIEEKDQEEEEEEEVVEKNKEKKNKKEEEEVENQEMQEINNSKYKYEVEENNQMTNSIENNELKNNLKSKEKKSQKSKKINNSNSNNKYIKIVSRKRKTLIFNL